MDFRKNIALFPFTTMKTGGPARVFVRVRTDEELRRAIRYARAEGLSVFILGGGSNILVRDTGWNGLVIKNELRGITYTPHGENSALVVARAGEVWDTLVKDTIARGFRGLENLSAIPGTVGAAPVQNIGAYGAEVARHIAWVEACNRQTLETRRFSNAECGFRYRWSIFKEENKQWIITRVAFSLRKDTPLLLEYKDLADYLSKHALHAPDAETVRRAITAIRAQKLPDMNIYGTAGSFFKNPVISTAHYETLRGKYPEMPGYPDSSAIKVPLAWILDHVCNVRGFRRGNVGLYDKQPLAVVHYLSAQGEGNATTREILLFADDIARMVHEHTGITVEREVEVV